MEINYTDEVLGWSALHVAAATHKAAAVKLLLEAGACKDGMTRYSGFAPLHFAVLPK